MANLKHISADGINVALDKADHYRLLNEPYHAESICLDVLEVDSQNQRAMVTLLLALTDQFPSRLHDAYQHAESLLPRLAADYDKHYFEGLIIERWAMTQIQRGTATQSIPVWLTKAMKCYELAERLSNSDNPEPILRWNTCVRLMAKIQANEPMPKLTRDIDGEFCDDVPSV